jgi:hypothetical protein
MRAARLVGANSRFNVFHSKAVGLNIARAGRVESYALPASVVQEFVAKVLDTQLVAAPATEQQP